MFLFITALVLQADDPLRLTFQFARNDPFDPTEVQVEVGRITRPGTHYWFRRTEETARTRTKKMTRTITWTDTDRCPAALSVAQNAAVLPQPRIAVDAINSDANSMVVNGVHYSFKGDSLYAGSVNGRLSFTGAEGTPLALWIEASLKVLSRCWIKDRPSTAM